MYNRSISRRSISTRSTATVGILLISLIFHLLLCTNIQAQAQEMSSDSGSIPSVNHNLSLQPTTPKPPLKNNGYDVHGKPSGINKYSNWHERTAITLINQARMSPMGFMDRYQAKLTQFPVITDIIRKTLYPSHPLYEHRELVEAARAHSLDMTMNNCFQHRPCNSAPGTSWEERVKQFYEPEGPLAENIGFGFPNALDMIAAWFESNSHRMNMLNPKYNLGGVGFKNRRWTLNLAQGVNHVDNPIASGSHFISPEGKMTFLANYYSEKEFDEGKGPKEAHVIINKEKYPIVLPTHTFDTFTQGHMGTYIFETDQTENCRTYHFEFVHEDGVVSRYPERGSLVTVGEGKTSCKHEYVEDDQ